MLVAIKGGLPQCAEPIVCGDVVGEGALFGHAPKIPSVVRQLAEDDFDVPDEQVRKLFLRRGAILWEGDYEKDASSALAVNFNLFLCGTVTSTFDALWYLKQHVDLPPWSGLLATMQTQGRGQMRREWLSPRGNMYLSILLPENTLFMQEAAAVVVGYLVVKALRAQGFDVYLKWPNDIITSDFRKIGGILLEERDGAVMAGIGLNLAWAPTFEQLRNDQCLHASTLSAAKKSGEKNEESFFHLSPFLLCKGLVNSAIVEYTYSLFPKDFATVMEEANALFPLKGKRVKVMDMAPHEQSGLCLGLGSTGGLLVRFDGGFTTEITSGEVLPESW